MDIISSAQRKTIINYLKSLSLGIDPISGITLPEDSILHNRRISNALADASLIVAQTLDSKIEAIAALSRIGKISIPSTTYPITISALCELVNDALRTERGTKIQPRIITTWLEQHGYLQSQSEGERLTFKIATPKGIELGITSLPRKSKYGSTYFLNQYNESACNYIIERLGEILFDYQTR